MEEIDIFDADLRPIGKKERRAAHFDGDWHVTFHLWVISSEKGGSVLYQWRSEEMENFPDMLDVSAAGHLLTGESMENGIREAEEELGVIVDRTNLQSLGYRVEVADQKNGQKNREYQGVHMARVTHGLEDFNPQIEEVSGLYWIGIEDGIDMFTGKKDVVNASGIYYDKSLREWKRRDREFMRAQFLPRIQNYYLTAHIMAERFLQNRFPLSIS